MKEKTRLFKTHEVSNPDVLSMRIAYFHFRIEFEYGNFTVDTKVILAIVYNVSFGNVLNADPVSAGHIAK